MISCARKLSILFALLLAVAAGELQAQSVSIDSSIFITGQYGRSSDIAVPLKNGMCFQDNNKFYAYLSDENGNFANEKLIGTFSGSYSLFVNGVIPASATAGTNYQVRIKTTHPVTVSDPSPAFSVEANTSANIVKVKTVPLSSNRVLTADYAFGWCKSPITVQNNFMLLNQSTAGAAVSAVLKNQITGDIDTTTKYISNQATVNLERNYYSYVAIAKLNGIISTKGYLLVNAPNRLQLATEGEQQGCIPDTMQFQVGTEAYTGGIGENFPGIKYKVVWGDGTTEVFSYCDLMDVNGIIKHSYQVTSCNQSGKTYNITISALLPWNSPQGCETPMVQTKARIFKKPIAGFTFPKNACVNTNVTFTNTTDPGQASFGNTCTINADYFWFVDGIAVQQNMNVQVGGANLTHKFTTPGKHYIRLVVDNGSCLVSEISDSICIDIVPQPQIKVNAADSVAGCAPLNFQVQNSSNQGLCEPFTANWNVIDFYTNALIQPGAATYTATPNSANNSDFNFAQEGKYYLSLSLSNTCGTFFSDSTIVNVLPKPKVNLPAKQTYCAPLTIDFGTDSLHKPNYNSFEANPTYNWVVTGGAYTFVNGTTAQSPYPQVSFSEDAVYTVQLSFGNNCGIATATQTVAISTSLQSTGGQITSGYAVCYGQNSGTIQLTNHTGSILHWEYSTDSGATWQKISDTSAAIFIQNLTATTQYKAIVKNGNCSAVTSPITTVTVLPALTQPAAGIDSVYCYQPSVHLSANAPQGTETGEWKMISGPSVVVFSNTALPITQVSGLQPGNYQFAWTIANNGCALADTVSITVLPELKNQIDTTTIRTCYQTAISIANQTFAGGTGTYLFQWQQSADGLNWTDIAGANSDSYQLSADSSIYIRRQIISGNCSSYSYSKHMIVYEPIRNNTIAAIQPVCVNTLPSTIYGSMPVAGADAAFLYQWEYSTDSMNWTVLTSAIAKDYQPTALTQTIWVRRAVSTAACSGKVDVSNAIKIEVIQNPTASFTASMIEGCSPLPVSFQNTNVEAGVSYTWNFGDGQQFNGVHATHTFTSAVADTFNVRLIATNVCASDTIFQPVMIKKLQPSFSISDSTGNCLPYSISFTNLSGASTSASWTFGDGTSDTGQAVTHSYTAYGTYYATLKVKSNNCTMDAVRKIVIAPSSGSFSYNGGTTCNTTAVKFQIVANNVDSVKILFGDGNSITTNDKTVFYTYKTAGNYLPKAILYAGQNGACTITLNGKDTIKADAVKAAFSTGKTIDCGSTTVQFLDSSKSHHGIKTWQWKFGTNGFSGSANPVYTYQSSNQWPVRLIVTSNSGCKDTLTTSVAVQVHSKPAAKIIADTVSCQDYKINYQSAVYSNDSIGFYSWEFANNLSAFTPNAVVNYVSAGSFQTRLIAATVYGCSDTALHTIVIKPKPNVKAPQPQTICKGTTVQLQASGAQSYQWSPVNGLSCIQCPNPKATPQQSVQYVITGTAANGCSASDSTYINVVQPVAVTLSSFDSVCAGEAVILSASGASSYKWFTQGVHYTNLNASSIKIAPAATITIGVAGTDDAKCFSDTVYRKVTVSQPLYVSLGNDKVLATGSDLKLQPKVVNGPVTDWKWISDNGSVNCATCPEPAIDVKGDACYTLEAKNAFGCIAKDTMCVKVFCESAQVFIPNAFTPDDDGVNDHFLVRAKGIKLIKSFRVFDRFGRVVFERANYVPDNSLSNAWDGKINGRTASSDVYIYVCDVLCDNNVPYSYKGNVALMK